MQQEKAIQRENFSGIYSQVKWLSCRKVPYSQPNMAPDTVRNNATGRLDQAITADGVYKLVRAYSAQLGFEIGAHALRATAATNALDHEADIAKVQEWLGHANIATTRIYDHRRTRPENSRLSRSPTDWAGGGDRLCTTPRRRWPSWCCKVVR